MCKELGCLRLCCHRPDSFMQIRMQWTLTPTQQALRHPREGPRTSPGVTAVLSRYCPTEICLRICPVLAHPWALHTQFPWPGRAGRPSSGELPGSLTDSTTQKQLQPLKVLSQVTWASFHLTQPLGNAVKMPGLGIVMRNLR